MLHLVSNWLRKRFWIPGSRHSGFGTATQCSIRQHNTHDSKFEANTCRVLLEFFPANRILTPIQHGLKTHFDFVLPGSGIVEPHMLFGNESFYDYYFSRKNLSQQYSLTAGLPIIGLTSDKELSTFSGILKKNSNKVRAFKEFQAYQLQTQNKKKVLLNRNHSGTIRLILGILSTIGWLLALFLLFF